MKSAIISKASGPPGKVWGSSISFESFRFLLKYPLFESSGCCKNREECSLRSFFFFGHLKKT